MRATVGVSASELESLSQSADSQMATAATVSLGYDQRWQRSAGTSQSTRVSVELRSAKKALQSDLVYKRYFAHGSYEYRRGKSTVMATATLGRITGQAPLFERFSLGDSSTLRGWNKYDIAPAGGNQVVHASLEYRNRGAAFFVDAGSVWDRDTDARVRIATGLGYHRDHVFLTLGLPVNTRHLGATLMMGIRY